MCVYFGIVLSGMVERGRRGQVRINAGNHIGGSSRAEGEDPRAFLQDMDRRFQLMGYDGPRRVEMTEVMLQNSAQVWGICSGRVGRQEIISSRRIFGLVF